MEQSFGFGLAVGLLVGFGNEKATQLWLGRLLRHDFLCIVLPLPVVPLIIGGFYVIKYAMLWLCLSWLFVAYDLSLLGFAVGILAYQLSRVIIMLLKPCMYMNWRQMRG
jgi:hypothetical protein